MATSPAPATARSGGSAVDTSRQGQSTQRSGAPGGAGGGDPAVSGVHCLRFGDTLQLFCEDVGGTGSGGFLAADGFSDGHCDIRRVLDEGAASKVADNLFRVVAKLQSGCQKKLAQQLAKSLEHVGGEKNPDGEAEAVIDPEDQAAIDRFRQEAHSEAVQNAYEVERSAGQVVHYGQTIQLEHLKSGKMLAIRSKEVADNESHCQKVCVSEHGGPDAWWVTEPRYRLMGSGEPVRYGDSISISSGKVIGFMLHVAKEATHDAALMRDPYEYYECNAYNVDVKTTWKFKCYTPYEPKLKNLIKGGDIVRLLHVETNRLLAHADAPPDADAGSVYLQCRRGAVSADTLWRIEHEDASDGRPTRFGTTCRLRHVLTDQYLALRQVSVSMVSTLDNVPQTVLHLSGTGAHREGKIEEEQLVYVMGSTNGVYLHPVTAHRQKGTPLVDVSETFLTQDALRILKVDERIVADCYQATSARTALHRFLDVQHQVDKDGGEPPETRFTYRFATGVLKSVVDFASGKEAADAARAPDLATDRTHRLRWRRQKLARELGLLDDIVDTTVLMHKKMKPQLSKQQSIVISSSPRRADPAGLGGTTSLAAPPPLTSRTQGTVTGNIELQASLEMYAASHKALQAAMDKCADNVEHLADFVPVLLQQMSGGQRLVAAARTTLNVMLSSESTLKEDIPLSVIEFFLGGIDTDPPAREEYINCLAKLLTNKGVGIKRNQDTILDRWLLNKRRSQLIYDTISPEKGIVQVRIRPEPSATPHGKPGGDMSANQRAQHGGSSGLQAKSAPAWGSGTVRVIDLEALTSSLQDKQLYAVYLGQLELLHKLCLGCNKDARALIGGPRKHVTYDALCQCIANERLPPTLRCLCTRLMCSLFVEGAPMDKVAETRTTFVIHELDSVEHALPPPQQTAAGDASTSFAADAAQHPVLKKDVLACLNSCSTFTIPGPTEGADELTLALCELIRELTSLGHYNDDKVLQTQLMPPVMAVLDFSSDHVVLPVDPRQGQNRVTHDRHVLCAQTEAMMHAKLSACRIMHLICDMRLGVRIQRTLAVAKTFMFEEGNALGRRANSMLFASTSFSGATAMEEQQQVSSAPRKGRAGVVSRAKLVLDFAHDLKDAGVHRKLKEIVEYMPLVFGLDKIRFSRNLLDTIQCQMPDLAQSALTLLIREHTPIMELYLQLFDTQLLRPKNCVEDYHSIQKELEQLHAYVNPLKITLTSARDPHRLTLSQREHLLSLLRSLVAKCSPDDANLPEFELSGRSYVNKEILRRSRAHEVVIEMLASCMTPFGDPDGRFVGAAVSLPGAAGAVAQESPQRGKAQGMEPGAAHWLVHELLPACFQMLEHFGRGLPRNQAAVAKHVNLISSFLRWGIPGVPLALAGIFDGNRALCESMDHAVIDAVIDYLAYGPLGLVATKAGQRTTVAALKRSQSVTSISAFDSFSGKHTPENPNATKPVHDVLCLRFLETAFNVEGQMVRHNQRYILHSLAAHGPVDINMSPEERTRSKYFSDKPAGQTTGPGAVRELALQLFRGEEGERVRAEARKVRAGVEDPLQDVLEYNIGLLRLLRFLAVDVGPGDLKLLRSLFDPTRLAADVCGAETLGRAKAQMLDLFCILYMKGGGKGGGSAMAMAALWRMLDYLEAQLAIADERALAVSFERTHGGDTLALPAMHKSREEAQKRANTELELLLADHWSGVLNALLSDDGLLEVMTHANRKTLESIFKRLMQLIEVVEQRAPLEQDFDTPRNAQEEAKVQETFVTIRALWKKLADMPHCPIDVPLSALTNHKIDEMEYELHKREVRKRFKLPKYTYNRPKEPTHQLIVSRKLQCLAQAFLNIMDPIVDESDWQETSESVAFELDGVEGGDEEEESEGEEEDLTEYGQPETRREMINLCKMFYDEIAVADNAQAMLVKETQSPTEALVDIAGRLPRTDVADWECKMMLLLRVLRGLVVHWQGSVTDSLPPKWILTSIPQLVVETIGRAHKHDRVVMMTLELAIVTLQVSPPAPVQQAFYDVMVASGPKSSEFLGELLLRMRRGVDEAIRAHGVYEMLRQGGTGRVDTHDVGGLDSLLRTISVHEQSLRGQARCLHLQMVQAVRHEVHATSHAEAIFRFLQLLCEGHNLRLQNFLRAQKNGIRSVDLVSATANYVISCTSYICPLVVSEPLRALQALAEYIQNPCRQNQRVLVDTALVASSNSLLNASVEASAKGTRLILEAIMASAGQTSSGTAEMSLQVVEDHITSCLGTFANGMHHLKAATITTLLALLECVDHPYIPGRMLETLGDEPLRLNMNNLLLEYNPALVRELRKRGDIGPDEGEAAETAELLSDDERAEAQAVAQQFYITYITLAEFDTSDRFRKGMTRDKIWDIDSLRKTVGAIEISRSGVLEKAYFIVPSLCQYLTHVSKQQILLGVNRANLQTMLTGFSEAFDSLYEEMKHQHRLQESKLLNLFRVTSDAREKVFFYNAILINVLLLLFYNYECNKTFICGDNEDLLYYRIKPGWRELVVVLSCVQCLLAITRQWWYVVERGIPIINRKIIDHSKRPPTNLLWAMMVWLPPELSDPVYRHIPKQNKKAAGMAPWRLHLVKVLYLASDFKFWTITAQTLMNVLALLIQHEGAKLLLTVHLLEIFAHSVVLQNVMRSITYRGNTLLQTAGLALVTIYFFGVIGFMQFPELFQFAEADIMGGRKLEPNNNGARCTSIWKCSLVVLDMGLRKGDLGEAMDDIGWDTSGASGDRYRIFWRMLYTLAFFIMVSTILMNIIFGVIIDTFAELRARKDEIDRDISGRCFICGIDRFVFDQLGEGGNGFEDHITNDHNMWKYLYFNVHLRQKDFDDYSGGESYVFSKTLELVRDANTHTPLYDVDTGLELKRPLPQIDLLWFPQKAAMRLRNLKASMEQLLEDKMKALQADMLLHASSLGAQIDKIAEDAAAHRAESKAGVPSRLERQRSYGVHV